MKSSATPIPLPLRAWFVVEVCFGVGAVLSIALFPTETRTNFAWDVQPAVMAAVLGAFYVSTALLFVLPLLARRWEMIRVMIVPAGIFSTATLITTFLHLDRFLVGTFPFYVWLVSYLLPPPIFFGYYLWQERGARHIGTIPSTDPLPAGVRTALILSGASLGILSGLLFVVPDLLIAVAPWKMTALTTRALLCWLFTLAALMLSMAHENDRARVLIGVPVLLLLLPSVTLQIARFAEQVNAANVALVVGYGFLLIAFALGVRLARGPWSSVIGRTSRS